MMLLFLVLLPVAASLLLASRQPRAALALWGLDVCLRGLGVWDGHWALRWDWWPRSGASFHLGLDRENALYVLLTGLLMGVAWVMERHRPHVLARHLAAAGVVTALVLTRDLLVWGLLEGTLLLVLFLDLEGGQERGNHPIKVLLTLAAGMWLTMAGSWFLHAWDDRHSYDWLSLAATPLLTGVPPWVTSLLFVCFLIGMAVKVTLFPWHRWLWRVTGEPGNGALWAVWFPLVGAYGLIEIVGGLFPDHLVKASGWLVGWALVNAWVALAQLGREQGNGGRLLGMAMGQASLLLLGLSQGVGDGVLGMWVLSYGLMVALWVAAYARRDGWGTTGAALSLMGVPGFSGAVVWWAIAGMALANQAVWAILTLVAVWLSASGLLAAVPWQERGTDRPTRWLVLALLVVSLVAGIGAAPLMGLWEGGRL